MLLPSPPPPCDSKITAEPNHTQTVGCCCRFATSSYFRDYRGQMTASECIIVYFVPVSRAFRKFRSIVVARRDCARSWPARYRRLALPTLGSFASPRDFQSETFSALPRLALPKNFIYARSTSVRTRARQRRPATAGEPRRTPHTHTHTGTGGCGRRHVYSVCASRRFSLLFGPLSKRKQ